MALTIDDVNSVKYEFVKQLLRKAVEEQREMLNKSIFLGADKSTEIWWRNQSPSIIETEVNEEIQDVSFE